MNEYLLRLSGFSKTSVVFFSLILGGAYFSFMYDDGTGFKTQIEQARADLEKEKEKEKESDLALKEIDLVKASLESLTQQFNLVSARLPREIQMAEVFKIIDGIARKSELSIKKMEPQTSRKEQVIEIVPIQITAEGKYYELIKFLHYVTSIERIFRVQNLQVRAQDEARMGAPVKITLDLVSYRFLPSEVTSTQQGVTQ